MTYNNRSDPGADGSVRKAHYGDGEQPWDTIVRLGWGPAFAAANVLKYLRRTKDPEHSLESARWYYRQLVDRTDWNHADWSPVLRTLMLQLTGDEAARLRG